MEQCKNEQSVSDDPRETHNHLGTDVTVPSPTGVLYVLQSVVPPSRTQSRPFRESLVD